MTMGMRSRQRGIGWFGVLCVLAVLGFCAVVGVKMLPLYLNQMKVASSVKKVATDPAYANAEAGQLRSALQRYWDIESIETLTPREIKVKRTEHGRYLSYDYEVRERLFYNIHVVLHFQDDVALRTQ